MVTFEVKRHASIRQKPFCSFRQIISNIIQSLQEQKIIELCPHPETAGLSPAFIATIENSTKQRLVHDFRKMNAFVEDKKTKFPTVRQTLK
jgi:hypothetical protein